MICRVGQKLILSHSQRRQPSSHCDNRESARCDLLTLSLNTVAARTGYSATGSCVWYVLSPLLKKLQS